MSAVKKKKRFHGFASLLTELFGGIVAVAMLAGGFAYHIESNARTFHRLQVQLAAEEEAREMALEKERKDFANIVCGTNIATHEVRNQKRGVRELTLKVIFAMASDPAFKVGGDVCKLARIKNLFSHIKYVEEIRANEDEWPAIYAQASDIYEGDRLLPHGWQCVRAFRVSNAYLAKLDDIGRAALGITPNGSGLKWFDETQDEVRTWGDISFFQRKTGCTNPHPTKS